MNLVDANVLLYAVNESDPRHEQARTWLDQSLGGEEALGFSWSVLLAFLRLSTRSGLFPNPLPPAAAVELVRAWLDQPASVVVEPSARHLDLLGGLLGSAGSAGNLVSDGHLAALSLDHDATVVTYDNDFGRFPGVRWGPPDAGNE